MKKKNQLSPKDQAWADARKRFRLSHAHIQMARELGLNPKKMGKLANHDQEPWKLPLPAYIEKLYRKHFKKDRPDTVSSIEETVKSRKRKQAERKVRKRQETEQGKAEETDEIPF